MQQFEGTEEYGKSSLGIASVQAETQAEHLQNKSQQSYHFINCLLLLLREILWGVMDWIYLAQDKA
jgi:hypothetical protein